MAYDEGVFINCPFDAEYTPLRMAIVFALIDCGFVPRCTLETINCGQARIQKIYDLIRECRYGIHDISRTEPSNNGLPRFNMPLELGIFLGAAKFGSAQKRRMSSLILDIERYRYQAFISDISGQDIHAHGDSESELIRCVRDWLADQDLTQRLPGGALISKRYERFKSDLPCMCDALGTTPIELTFSDYGKFVATSTAAQPLSAARP